jgi:hypothetical protein
MKQRQKELGASIEERESTVDPDDGVAIRKLADDKTRLGLFPAKIAQLQKTLSQDEDCAFKALKVELVGICARVAKEGAAQREKLKTRVEAFLLEIMGRQQMHYVEEITSQILWRSMSLRTLEALSSRFTPINVTMETSCSKLLIIAERLISELS